MHGEWVSLMPIKHSRKWTYEMLKEEALKYNVRERMKEGSNGALQKIRNEGYLELLDHMEEQYKPDEYYINLAKQYEIKKDLRQDHPNEYMVILRRGIADIAFSHMPKKYSIWKHNKENVQREANKYTTRNAFREAHKVAYNAAQMNGWLDDVCSHMEDQFRWTKELIQEIANKYSLRKDFYYSSEDKNAYMGAQRLGCIDEVCSHMRDSTWYDYYNVIYMWNTIEYPNIWKIGISNDVKVNKRIKSVLSQTNFTLNEVFWRQVHEPWKLEKNLIKLGRATSLEDLVDGKTEIRLLTSRQVKEAKKLIFIEEKKKDKQGQGTLEQFL